MNAPAVPLLLEPHPVHRLLTDTMHKPAGLATPGTAFHPNLNPRLLRFAMSQAGGGLDHTIGEQALVFADFSTEHRGAKYPSYFLMTDRRFLTSAPYADVRYRAIEQVHFKDGLLTIELKLKAEGAWHDVSFNGLHEQIRRFLGTITPHPPDHREPPARPLCAPSEADPTGALSARAWMPHADPRTELLYAYVHEAHAQQAMPVEVARDLVARITLAYRNLAFGRGFHQTRYMSPVSADDLIQLFAHVFGPPTHQLDGPVRRLVFATHMRSNAGVAALSTVAGALSKAVIGVGWRHRARPSVPYFELMLADTGSFASYKLLQTNGGDGLHRKVAAFAHDVHENLLTLEDALLLRRCVYGWNADPLSLLNADPSDVLQRLAAIVGPFDPAVLSRHAG